jgi:hypothetical protein
MTVPSLRWRRRRCLETDQRMRLECGVGFRQLRTCRRTRPGQLCADFVAKVENRSALKISRKPIFGLLCCCIAFQRGYEGPCSILDETIWSLTSPGAQRISGSKNFRSPPQKDFCNNIGTERTSQPDRRMSAFRGKAEVGLRGRQVSFGPRPCKNVFSPPKLQAAGRDPRGRDRLSIFLLYRVWSQSGRNLEPC